MRNAMPTDKLQVSVKMSEWKKTDSGFYAEITIIPSQAYFQRSQILAAILHPKNAFLEHLTLPEGITIRQKPPSPHDESRSMFATPLIFEVTSASPQDVSVFKNAIEAALTGGRPQDRKNRGKF